MGEKSDFVGVCIHNPLSHLIHVPWKKPGFPKGSIASPDPPDRVFRCGCRCPGPPGPDVFDVWFLLLYCFLFFSICFWALGIRHGPITGPRYIGPYCIAPPTIYNKALLYKALLFEASPLSLAPLLCGGCEAASLQGCKTVSCERF